MFRESAPDVQMVDVMRLAMAQVMVELATVEALLDGTTKEALMAVIILNKWSWTRVRRLKMESLIRAATRTTSWPHGAKLPRKWGRNSDVWHFAEVTKLFAPPVWRQCTPPTTALSLTVRMAFH